MVLRIAAEEVIAQQSENEEWSLTKLVYDLQELGTFSLANEFDSQLNGQPKIYRNFMKLIEIMLLFVRASRQGLWELHLASLERFVKFFFAYDQQNYARLSPVYLSEMYALQENDSMSWEFLKSGNFSVNKSTASFCALGTDLEQENRKLKILGGISGIANKMSTMDSYFIAAPILNRICEKFAFKFTSFHVDVKQHHHLKGSTNARFYNDVNKLINVYESHDVDFGNTEDVFHLITKVVLPPTKASMFLNHEAIGEEMYATFKEERLQGKRSVWEPLKKRRLPIYH